MRAGNYNWADLRRLVRKGRELSPELIANAIRKEYAFLDELTEEETILAGDPYQREQKLYHALVSGVRAE